jgi:hypothetical protein
MRLRSKFSPRWDGPYVVTRKMGSLNYTVRRETENFGLANSELVVHVNRMKLLPPKKKINQKKNYIDTNLQELNRETVIQTPDNSFTTNSNTETSPQQDSVAQETQNLETTSSQEINSDSDKVNEDPTPRS